MISIIISSISTYHLEDVKLNIEQTIGIPFEIISFENANGCRGLCELYNEGAQKATFDTLCYMHEDIKILTPNWGVNVINHFINESNLGVIGVAGSSYKTLVPSGWGAAGALKNVCSSNYIQHYKHEIKPAHFVVNNPSGEVINNAVCVDGMWFCTKKSIVLSHPFDEKLLTGFHCYDIDFCLNVGMGFKIAVIFDVLLEHFSEGSYNKFWIADTMKLHQKWGNVLPRSSKIFTDSEKYFMEKRAFKMLLKELIDMDHNYNYCRKLIENVNKTGKLRYSLYCKIHFYLLKYFLIGKKITL